MANPTTPRILPPGVVPSASREDVATLLEQEQYREQSIVREVTIGDQEEKKDGGEREQKLPDPPVPAGTPPKAWEEIQCFRMDLSDGEEDGRSATTGVLVRKGGYSDDEDGAAERRMWSPFTKSKNTVQDLRKETILSSKKPAQQQTTPKRPMSPLKRFNKVAPIPTTPTKPTGSQFLPNTKERLDSRLQSSSASILDDQVRREEEEAMSVSTSGQKRPGSAPTTEGFRRGTLDTTTKVVVQSQTKDTVERESQNQTGGVQPVAPSNTLVEPLYSTVVKVKKKSGEGLPPTQLPPADQATSKIKTEEPEILAALPKLEPYEPPTTQLDTSLVIGNPSIAVTATMGSHDSHMASHDPVLYDTIAAELEEPDHGDQTQEVEMPAYNAAMYKGLKKHDDNGNVHLVSVKGISDLSESQSMNFPLGSSADMQPIHYAAASGNKKALLEILSVLPIAQDPVELVLGTDRMCKREGVDGCDSEGRTPLMHAVHSNQIQCVKILAEAGANVNADANDGSTCLHHAAYSGSVEMLALLLSLGADGLRRDKEGRTALHWCTNNSNPQCINMLIDRVPGLDANFRDGAMMTPLMWSAFHGKPEHIEKLMERGADSSLIDMDGMTAIHWSVQRHDTRALQALINAESSKYVDIKGKTVMHQAAEQGCAKAVSLIKAVRPTSVDDIDINGRTPLHWATVCENPEVIRALLANGADPNVRDSSGYTALDYATERGLHYCALLLSKNEGIDEPDGYHSFLTYGTTSASLGGRAQQQQEGQPLDPQELKSALSEKQIFQMQSVCAGSWMSKFTNEGRGPLHPRFFHINPTNGKLCLAKSRNASDKDTKSDLLVGVRSSASPAIFRRKDFDPLNKHKFVFTIFTTTRVLDVLAPSSEDFKIWLNGLQLLLHLGSTNTTRLLSLIQSEAAPDQLTEH